MAVDKEENASSQGSASHSRPCHHRHVEIATLSIPTTTAGSGVESGDGTNFILEAHSRVIDQLVENEQHQGQLHNLHQENTPCIEGVVDLEMVSHLVTGVTEREFVTLLHQDLTHAHQHAVDDPSPTIQRTNLETIREGRRQSLKSKDVKYERERLLQESASDDGTTTARLLLSADPFVQTIAEVHFEHDDDVSTIGGSFTRISEMEGSVHYEGGGGGVMSSEAFLLSIPTHTLGNADEHAMSGSYYSSGGAGGAKENMFVLALPEMDIQPKEEETDFSKPTNMFRSSATSVSSTVAAVAAEEISHFLRHPFAPLPTDVQHIEICVSTTPAHLEVKKDVGDLEEPPLQEAHLDVVIDRKVPLIAYIILVTGLIALSSTGVSYDVQRGGVSPEMKTFWRFNSTSVAFFFLAMKSFNRKEFAKYSKMELLVWMPFAGLNYSFMCTAFVIALDMTSLVNTLILSNMASLLIIGSNLALGAPVLFFEGLGALIGLAGALICAKASSGDDDDEDEANSSRSRAMMGNIIAFLASVSTAFYLIVAKNLRPKVDLFLFMFQIFTLASIFLFIYMQQSGQECELSFHPEIGFFGWMNPQLDRLPLELYMAIICNGVGTTGYIAIMKYFDPVVVSMVMLMEPVIAAFMGVAAGVSTLPGWVTWAGDAVVTVGSLMVISSGSKKTESIDATGALHTLEGDDNIEGRKSNASFPKSPMLMKSPMLINSRGGLAKSPLLMKIPLVRTDERGFTRSPATMKSPRVMKSPHRGKNMTGNITRKIKRDVNMDGDMEIGSVKGRPRSVSMGGEGHRVIWN